MATILSVVILLIVLAVLALYVLFIKTLVDLMSVIPADKRFCPAWLNWLMIVPVLNYFVGWLMLPFALPMSVKASAISDAIVDKAKLLFRLGLVLQLCPTFSVLLGGVHLIGALLFIVGFAVLIWYWVTAHSLKSQITSIKPLS